MKSDLIVIEGFDRIGKDVFLSKMKSKYSNDAKTFVYIQIIPSTMPKYRTDPIGFTEWLTLYIDSQLSDLEKLNEWGYSRIIMTRLVLSDFVYSNLFNRAPTVKQFYDRIFKSFNLANHVFLYENYNEYLNRLKLISSGIEYPEDEFNRINNLYEFGAKMFEDTYHIPYTISYLKANQYLSDVFEL